VLSDLTGLPINKEFGRARALMHVFFKSPCILKLELGFQLNHSWSIITANAAQNAGRWRRQVRYLAERLILELIVGESKIRVVEEVEELEANPKCGPLPARYFRIFHNAEIGVEIAWASKAVAPLRKLH